MENKRVARISRWMALICLGLMVALPFINAVVVFGYPEQIIANGQLAAQGITTLSRNDRVVVFAITLAASMPVLWGLFQLRGLFRCYADGEVFSKIAARFLSRFALALLLDALTSSLGRTVMVLALTFHNAPGHRELVLGIGSNELGTAFIGVTFLVIAWVMAEAATVAEENKSFV